MPTTTTAAMTATTGMNNDGYNGNDGNNNNNVNSDTCSAKQSCFAIYSKDKKSLLFQEKCFVHIFILHKVKRLKFCRVLSLPLTHWQKNSLVVRRRLLFVSLCVHALVHLCVTATFDSLTNQVQNFQGLLNFK